MFQRKSSVFNIKKINYTFRCNSAATRAKNSSVGPNPVPSSPRNSTSNIALRSACALIT